MLVFTRKSGQGLMIGVELITDALSKTPAPALAHRLVQELYHKGVLTLPCGKSTLRFCPPLVIDESLVEEALAILETCLKRVEA